MPSPQWCKKPHSRLGVSTLNFHENSEGSKVQHNEWGRWCSELWKLNYGAAREGTTKHKNKTREQSRQAERTVGATEREREEESTERWDRAKGANRAERTSGTSERQQEAKAKGKHGKLGGLQGCMKGCKGL